MTIGRIALVDDDPSVRCAISRLLRSVGYEARDFDSAEDLLASGCAERSSCLVVDIHLGGISGFELVERLHASGIEPGLLFISAESDPGSLQRARELGAIAYLTKPFEAETLLEAIAEALERPGPARRGRNSEDRARDGE